MSLCTRGPKSNTTEYNKANTQLKIMQWNAEGEIRKKTELEHILKKENMDIMLHTGDPFAKRQEI